MKNAVWLLVATLTTPAIAGPCDVLSDPMAYNACLAKQGPAAQGVGVARHVSGRAVIKRPRGRSELVFSPGR